MTLANGTMETWAELGVPLSFRTDAETQEGIVRDVKRIVMNVCIIGLSNFTLAHIFAKIQVRGDEGTPLPLV